jgi:hypothetical protein
MHRKVLFFKFYKDYSTPFQIGILTLNERNEFLHKCQFLHIFLTGDKIYLAKKKHEF